MAVIERPKDRGPLFGEQPQIIIGGGLVQQLREWQQKKRLEASLQGNDEDRDQQDPAR